MSQETKSIFARELNTSFGWLFMIIKKIEDVSSPK